MVPQVLILIRSTRLPREDVCLRLASQMNSSMTSFLTRNTTHDP